MQRPLRLRRFLELDRDYAREQPNALREVVGDATLLHSSPFYQRVRAHVSAGGVRFVAQPKPTTLMSFERQHRDRIEFFPNLASWRDAARSADVVAGALRSVTSRSSLVRTTAMWLARSTLDSALPSATSFLLVEAFSDAIEIVSGMYEYDAYAHQLSHWMNCQTEYDTAGAVGPFRILENFAGTELAVACVISHCLGTLGGSAELTEHGARGLLRALGASQLDQDRGASLLVALGTLLKPGPARPFLLALSQGRARIKSSLAGGSRNQRAVVDAVRKLARTLSESTR